jgi:xanthosine phosphorylase
MSAFRSAVVIAEHAFDLRPRIAIILGTGLGDAVTGMERVAEIAYDDLPGFPRPTVSGHSGRLILGRIAGIPVAVLAGRVHVYEGASPGKLALPVRALKLAGIELLLLTNAAGSLRPEIGPGCLVAVSDHINLMGINPLTGPNDERFGPRFPSLRDAYDPALRAVLDRTAQALNIRLETGVYLACSGPSFETPAEIRAFRILGADLVGMSTVPEVIAARHCGLRVAAISVVTNLAEGLGPDPASHAETLAEARGAAADLGRLIEGFIAEIASDIVVESAIGA